MATLPQEFRQALEGATHIQEDFVTGKRITIVKRGAAVEFDWECGETRYPDDTKRTWARREAQELPATKARELVGVYFDGDEAP